MFSYPIFDPHWHFRDDEESEKDTVGRGLAVCDASGIIGVSAMPNPKRGLTTRARCEEYYEKAKKANSKARFYINVGVTVDPKQAAHAVDVWTELPYVIALKQYLELSTNELSVLKRREWLANLEVLADKGFTGVLMLHVGCQDCNKDDRYDQKNPKTWSTVCRPEESEAHAFDDFIGFAEKVKFAGTLYACHMSTLHVADAIHNYKGPLKLSGEVTPHHAFLNNDYLDRCDGVLFKCNPPLRPEKTRAGLEERLLDGRIKIIGSDHAPHTLADKQGPKPASGLPVGLAWLETIAALERRGMSPQQIKAVVCDNAVKLFGDKLKDLVVPDRVEVDIDRLNALKAAYPYDVSQYIK